MSNDFWACGRPTGPYRGKFPLGFLNRVDEIWDIEDRSTSVLFPFGGATPDRENWTINDIDESLDVDTHHDARDLPKEWDEKFDVVLSDPPYSQEKAKSLYSCEYPGPKSHYTEACRVVKPGGTVLILDWLVYTEWTKRMDRKQPVAVTCGPNQRIRVLNVFDKPL